MNEILIPAGREFLPKTDIPYLRKIQKTEQDPKAQTRLLAYIMRKQGSSIRDIGRALNKSYSTVRDWLMRVVQMGISGRYDEKRPGAPPRLDHLQTRQLRADLTAGPQECGFESGLWTARLLAEHIRRKFGVQYGTSGIYEMLHRMGFSWQTPRPRHPKSASRPERDRFKKKPAGRRHTIPKRAMPYWPQTRHPS